VSTSHAIDEASQFTAPRGRSRLRGYLVRRARRLARLMLILAIGVAFMAGALEIWRGASLLLLPDIGDPFDVAAFRAVRIPEDRDAAFLLREAEERVSRRMPNLSFAARRLAPAYQWSAAAPELRDWVTANRDALELFRDASERPDAAVHPALDRDHFILVIGDLVALAFLEASRLEQRGEMAEAWNWYRAIFRVKLHIMRRGPIFCRWIAYNNCSSLRTRITAWAADPRTNVLLIRRALDDILAGEPKSEWDAFSLKADYLDMIDELAKDWGPVQQGEEEDQIVRIGGERLPPALGWIPYAAKRYVWNEPQRSRRVLRLAFANWLANAQEKDPQYLKPTVRATFQIEKRSWTVYLYAVNPVGRSAARELTPRVLAEWLVGTRDAKFLLSGWPWPGIRATERREYRALVVLLAGELYKRDHGTPASSDQMLVGPYLHELPADGSAELDDGSAPMIREGDATASAKEG
jgi:hypothetical protein